MRRIRLLDSQRVSQHASLEQQVYHDPCPLVHLQGVLSSTRIATPLEHLQTVWSKKCQDSACDGDFWEGEVEGLIPGKPGKKWAPCTLCTPCWRWKTGELRAAH